MKVKEVTAAIIERDGKFLITQRSYPEELRGKWEFPGGKVETSETPEECLKREIKEELGLDCEVGKLLTTSEFQYPKGKIVLKAYLTKIFSDAIMLNEHLQFKWVSPSEFSDYDFLPADIPVYEVIINKTQQL